MLFGFVLFLLILAVPLYFVFRTTLTVERAQAIANGEELVKNAKRVLVVTAHPDDAEWWVSGTLRLLAKQGATIHLIIASDGEKGSNHVGAPDLSAARRQEALDAGRIVGYEEIHFLGLPDRGVAKSGRLQNRVEAIWKEFQPDTVITFDGYKPALPYLHIDHESTGRTVTQLWERIGKSSRVSLYLFHTRRPDTAVEISSVVDVKIQALQQHRSQGVSGAQERIRGYNRGQGSRVGTPDAELLRRVR